MAEAQKFVPGDEDYEEEFSFDPRLEQEAELKGAGLLSGRVPSNLNIPVPIGDDEFAENEDPITQMDLEELGLLTPKAEEDD